MEPWVWPLALTILLALLGAIVALFRRGTERTERRLDEHIREDTTAHERLRAVETKIDNIEREVAGLRERWHDLRGEISTTLGNWYVNIVKLIGKDDR